MVKRKLLAIVITLIFLVTPIVFLRSTMVSTPNLSVSEPVRVACVGDSITKITSYASDLQTMLGSNYSVNNFGVSGSTVTLDSYKPYIQQQAFDKAENYEPNIVVIMLGTNDAHSYLEQYNGTFEQDYVKLTHSFQELDSKPQILIVESPPVFNNSLGIDPTFFSDTIIPHIQNVADTQNLSTVDVYDAFGNQSNYTLDGIHPNDEGSTLIASQVCDAITLQDDLSSNNPAS